MRILNYKGHDPPNSQIQVIASLKKIVNVTRLLFCSEREQQAARWK